MNKIMQIISDPGSIFLALCLLGAIAITAVMLEWVKKWDAVDDDEEVGPCCRCCAYWFKEDDRGMCEKHSSKNSVCYTAPTYFCRDFDGIFPWEEDLQDE